MSEFDRIAAFVRLFARARVPVGIGDDCAVLAAPARGRELCVTTDTVVENLHFTRDGFSMEDIGHKALAVNLSDLAAMGAEPSWFVCALEVPDWVDDAMLLGLARGMSKLARAAGIALVGGNMTRAQALSLTLTVAGEVPRGKALLRRGARPGDRLYVSGSLGEARAGLVAGAPRSLVARQLRPSPRLKLGMLARAFASAGVDISDGFAQDLGHICDASHVGALVRVDDLPLSPTLRRFAGDRARDFALSGGEDYELILAVPPRRARAFERAAQNAKHSITCVGELTRARRRRFVDARGAEISPSGGFDHFAR